MQVINDFKLLNVRVSKSTFGVIKMNAPFMDTTTLFKGEVFICCDFHVENMMKKLEESIVSIKDNDIAKEYLRQKSELSEMLGAMKKQGCLFAHVMAE